jgi:hypothetical protein
MVTLSLASTALVAANTDEVLTWRFCCAVLQIVICDSHPLPKYCNVAQEC